MSKAEKFINDYTKDCSNAIYDPYDTGDAITIYAPWLTPDQAREAVKIAREEIYEWLSNNVFEDKYLDLRKIGIDYAFYGYKVDTLINDLKQAMKDE